MGNGDFLGAVQKQFWKHGVRPDAFADMTPHQIFAVLWNTEAGDGEGSTIDKLELARQFNELRAKKGLMPIIPKWM